MKIKILLAHYEPRARQQMFEKLRDWGFQVVVAADGYGVIRGAEAANPDLFLIYAPLPKINVADLLQTLRKHDRWTRTPIVIFSDIYRSKRFADEMVHKFGATAYMEWPLEDEELLRQLNRYLHPHTTSGPPVAAEQEKIEKKKSRTGSRSAPRVQESLAEVEAIAQQKARPRASSTKPGAAPQKPESARAVDAEDEDEEETEDRELIVLTSEDIFSDVLSELGDELNFEQILETQEPALEPARPAPKRKRPRRRRPKKRKRVESTQVMPAPTRETEAPGPSPPSELPPQAPPPAGQEVAPAQEEGIPFGPYRLLESIDIGGMAEIYKAKKTGAEGFEKVMAIKRILPHLASDDEFVTMFIDEAKVSAQLNHPNIVQIFDFGKINHDYYIAMEYVEGKDLKTLLRKARREGRTVPLSFACAVAIKVLAALDYAHRARDASGSPLDIVHRDVSPQNILISYEGEVKLTDFGVAKAAIKSHQTIFGALKGKLLYMSPEQAWGRPVDGRSDIFSIGVILYEMLSGRPLFYEKGDNEVSILEKVRAARVPDIRQMRPDCPEGLSQILMRALAKDPEERYQRAAEMQRDLEAFMAETGLNAAPLTVARFIADLFPDEAAPHLAALEEQGQHHVPKRRPRKASQPTPSPSPEAHASPEPQPRSRPQQITDPGLDSGAEPQPKHLKNILYPSTKPTPRPLSWTKILIIVIATAFLILVGLFGFLLRRNNRVASPSTPRQTSRLQPQIASSAWALPTPMGVEPRA